MKRSIGVTVVAVITILGSLLTLLAGTMAVLAAAVAPPSELQQAQFMRPLMFVGAGFIFAFGGWGIATGIGLLRLRAWARICVIVFSVLLLIGSLPAIPVILLMPLPPPPNGAPVEAMAYVKIFMGAMYAVQAAVGVWWLVLFTRKRVKEQFRRVVVPPGVPVDVLLPPASTTVSNKPGRPVSISVIAWFLIAGAAMILISAGLRYPAVFFTVLLTGWGATALYLLMAAVQVAIGIGLLKLNPTARIAAIALFVYGLVNSVVFWVAPGREARFDALMKAMPFFFPMPQLDIKPMIMMGMVAGVIGSVVVTSVVLWFLVARKPSFVKASLPAGSL